MLYTTKETIGIPDENKSNYDSCKKLSDLLFMQIEYWHYSKFKKQRYKNTAICRYFDTA